MIKTYCIRMELKNRVNCFWQNKKKTEEEEETMIDIEFKNVLLKYYSKW